MKRVVGVIAVALFAAACASNNLQKPATQDDFGVQMAKMNLWREAMFRFKRAVQIDPNDAKAHNNLAVAYEAVGDFDNARKEYLEALKLDRTNPYIQKNYSRYVEFLSRNRKRQPKETPKTASGVAMPKEATGTKESDVGPPPTPAAGTTPKPVNAPAPPSDLPPPSPPGPPAATPPPSTPPPSTPPVPPPGGVV